MWILIVLGVASLILGILFLINEKILKKIGETMNKVIIEDENLSIKYKKPVGVFMIIFALILFFIAYRYVH